MSRTHILQCLLDEEQLFELPSLFTGLETARTVIVTPDILDAVMPPFPSDERGIRLEEFRKVLDAFSEGGEFTVANDPRSKPSDTMLARVESTKEDFFSFRVTDPEETPGIRCLGAFADKDTFVALTWEFREDIALFDEEVDTVKAAWRQYFGNEAPHSGDHLDDYLSNCVPV